MMIKSLMSRLRGFLRHDTGSLTVEMMITLPLLVWAHVALFVFWDVFRVINTAQKASYTISDILSREQVDVDAAYIDGMRSLLVYLQEKGETTKLRVTSFTWTDVSGVEQFEVQWSYSPQNAKPVMTTEMLQLIKDKLPTMEVYATAILLESELDYVPPMNIGMDNYTFSQFIVTPPRFLASIGFITPDGGGV